MVDKEVSDGDCNQLFGIVWYFGTTLSRDQIGLFAGIPRSTLPVVDFHCRFGDIYLDAVGVSLAILLRKEFMPIGSFKLLL